MIRPTLIAALFAVSATTTPPPTAAPEAPASVVVYDTAAGLGEGWNDLGWAEPRHLEKGAPASFSFANQAGWIVASPGLTGSFGWLTLRVRAPDSFGSFLEVGLDSAGVEKFPRVRLTSDRGRPASNGFTEYRLTIRELDPKGVRFDRIVFHAWRDVGREPVLIDAIALVAADKDALAAELPATPVHMTIDCSAQGRPISPLIYGIGAGDKDWWDSGVASRRWGGNATTRYNWELGYTWNAGADWFFRNLNYSGEHAPIWQRFLEENVKHGVKSALTVPMIGWVAKDDHSYSFPVSELGPQKATAPENKDMGNGVKLDGTLLKPLSPERTSVAEPPASITKWVQAIHDLDQSAGTRTVAQYILDNEPTLWSINHRDVHPEPLSYDELLDRTLRYGAAIRQADPKAIIAGPAAWGWTALFFSGVDVQAGSNLHLDRLAHANKPFLPWYLAKVRENEKRMGTRVLDVVDVHFYPQAANIGIGTSGGIDPQAAALRIRTTRALWDPSYVDESWIGEPIRLIPRLREWIDTEAPGLGISIGEWNFGAEGHMSGGLAVAEALGRFGQLGLASAFYWTAPPPKSPAWWAFRAFRNFDGKGARFLDRSLPAQTDGQLFSGFASGDDNNEHIVAVLLNEDPSLPEQVSLNLRGCGRVRSRRTLAYTDGRAGFTPVSRDEKGTMVRLLPYSITVLDLTVDRR
jgi:hypothetical protein